MSNKIVYLLLVGLLIAHWALMAWFLWFKP
jgi:hypothetical protein